MPPLPRSHHAPRRAGRSRPLRPKRSSPEAVRALRARRLRELRLWLDRNVLHGRMSLRLSEASVTAPDAPRRWLEVARLRHLARGRDLQRLEIALADVDENSPVLLEGARDGLEAPDCLVEDRAANGKAGGDP